MAIKDDDYNRARAILMQAGSMTATASHQKHTQGAGSPEGHGKSLLREARDEFRASDAGGQNLRSGMTLDHHDAITKAAAQMGIDTW